MADMADMTDMTDMTDMNRHYEVLVVGGGLAGVAAAAEAADAGRRTMLAESRTFLGGAWASSLRYWVNQADFEALSEELAWPRDSLLGEGFGECGLVPVQIKLALETYVLGRGVTLLYAVRPMGWRGGNGGFEVEFAGKFGKMTVTADRVVDATEQGTLLQCTADLRCRCDGRAFAARRVLEITGAANGELKEQVLVPVPEGVPDTIRIHPAGQGAGHLRVEHAIRCEADPMTPLWMNRLELQAREDSYRLFLQLRSDVPAFRKAKLTNASQELFLPPLFRLSSPGADGAMEGTVPLGAGERAPASAFRMPGGMWLAGGCADIGDDPAERLNADPLALVRLGRTVGRLALGAAPAQAAGSADWHRLRTVLLAADVLVVGGGTSGTPAAIAAARSGAKTVLAEMNHGLGGTGTLGGVDSYWFGRREGFTAELVERIAEEHAAVGITWKGVTAEKWNIEARMQALLTAVRESGTELLLYAVLAEMRTGPDGAVTGAEFVTPYERVEVECKAVVDATGDGDAAVLAGAEFVYGSDREAVTMWYSMVPEVRPGVNRNNFTSTVEVGDPTDYTRAHLAARRRYAEYDHRPYLAPRESRHICGEVRLTLTDQLLQRRWADVVNIAFSNHDIKGHSTSDWVRMGLIPPNLLIEIPYRALVPAKLDGLLVAGKAISGTHDALPAIRMQADLENLGAVCGIAAALSIRRGCRLRDLPVRELQEKLLAWGILPEEAVRRELRDREEPLDEAAMRDWISRLDDGQKLYDYADMGFLDVCREPIPIVVVCTAGDRIVPLLKEELGWPDSPRRLTVARALAWYGDPAATPVLLEHMEPFLAEAELPPRRIKVKHVQAPPDQGAMPELAYLLYTLAMAADERAIPVMERAERKLKPSWEKLTDGSHGLFYYVDSLCDIAERLGSPACIPILRRLLQEPLFHGRKSNTAFQPDFFEERAAYLELVTARSLARCGDPEGLRVLAAYLGDTRKLLVAHAHRELQRITGWRLPAEAEQWLPRIESEWERVIPSAWTALRGLS
ncbi:MAG: FAD-dependent oxidoreductase [Paenibacillaceae bacterium]|nr:FAD-dependent oxidoreductase [Paenibacillaceae bacterium]